MKTITIDLAESVVEDLEQYARQQHRPTADVVREAIENYRLQKIVPGQRKSIAEHPVFSVGEVLRPLGPDDDLLEEMLDEKE